MNRILAIGLLSLLAACSAHKNSLDVTATAYNSVAAQTDGDPTIAAWGDKLDPAIPSIAVSRDLLKLGLTHNVEVEIEGMPGTFLVRDKLHKRWEKRIDIYMGTDVEAARRFGKQGVRIYWSGG